MRVFFALGSRSSSALEHRVKSMEEGWGRGLLSWTKSAQHSIWEVRGGRWKCLSGRSASSSSRIISIRKKREGHVKSVQCQVIFGTWSPRCQDWKAGSRSTLKFRHRRISDRPLTWLQAPGLYYQWPGVWYASGVWNPRFPLLVLTQAFWDFFLD